MHEDRIRRSAERERSRPVVQRRPAPASVSNAALARWAERTGATGRVLARSVKIKGAKKTQTFSTYDAFKRSDVYARRVTPLLQQYDPARVEFHLRQLFSQDVEYENEEHFIEALTYDVQTKSISGEAHTLQERYMTEYGWRQRQNPPSAGKSKTRSAPLAQPAEDVPNLKIYRTMKVVQWEALEKGDSSKLTGHLGDYKQAHNYLHRKSPEPKVLIEFTLHPGAERTLFSSSTMAFPNVPGPRKLPNMIRGALEKEGAKDGFAEASKNEGLAPGKVGVKSEHGEAGFSFGIGGRASAEAFMKLVATKKEIGRSAADKTAKEDIDPYAIKDRSELDEAAGRESAPEEPMRESRETRWRAFLTALAHVPVVQRPADARGERADPSNQFVGMSTSEKQGEATKETKRFEASGVIVTPNAGGGDCLFHALAGRDLSEPELLVVRQTVAAMRAGMVENQALNALNVAAALTQSGEEDAQALIEGRHRVPDAVYALLQAVPGVYAGEDELIQWCAHHNRRVTVMDPSQPLASGALAVYSPQGREVIPVTEATMWDTARVWAGRTLMLFKTPGHWERVTRVTG